MRCLYGEVLSEELYKILKPAIDCLRDTVNCLRFFWARGVSAFYKRNDRGSGKKRSDSFDINWAL